MWRLGLQKAKRTSTLQEKGGYKEETHCVFLFACYLTRTLEVDTKICEFTFVILTRILDCVDMEGNCETVHRQDNCLGFTIDKYLAKLSLDRK